MWYMHDIGRGWMILGSILVVLFWGGIIALIFWGVNKLTRQHGSSGEKTALDIAKERYARGEISREQFEEIKKNL
jgi:putative membrane protein